MVIATLASQAQADQIAPQDVDRIIQIFEDHCLGPVLAGDAPSAEGFRAPRGENAAGYTNSVTRDDRVMFQVYTQDGRHGCGADNSVYTAAAFGSAYPMLQDALNAHADGYLARDGFAEMTDCHDKIEGSWGRYFVQDHPAKAGAHLSVLVSATQPYENGGLSLQERAGPMPATCEDLN